MSAKCVALLAEGVDRNEQTRETVLDRLASPSSRRAWIEIRRGAGCNGTHSCRPPRGGRG